MCVCAAYKTHGSEHITEVVDSVVFAFSWLLFGKVSLLLSQIIRFCVVLCCWLVCLRHIYLHIPKAIDLLDTRT